MARRAVRRRIRARIMRFAFATCSALPDGARDDHAPAALLGADVRTWDDPSVDWNAYDRVVLRSTWDYTKRPEAFLAWCRAVGPRLRNRPELVAFNADKRYLAALDCPTVPTAFVAPGDPPPPLAGEVVVKPGVSAGARLTGRFGPAAHAEARALIGRIHAAGRVALVQPYLASVDERGETALVFFGGELSHVLRKRAVLRPDEVAPTATDGTGVAAVMHEPDLVAAGEADATERALAQRVVAEIAARFGTPLYARIDLVRGADDLPLLLELEAIEPALYLATAPGAAERFANAARAA
jgi:hypothetical protein